jgi:ribosome biogenesis protein Nip4
MGRSSNDRSAKLKKTKFKKLYESNMGNISKTCKAAGINRHTFYHWIKSDEKFKAEIEEIEEITKDDVEWTLGNLAKGIPKFDENGNFIGWRLKPDTVALIWYSKTKMKDRGYVEKQELQIEDKPTFIVDGNKDSFNTVLETIHNNKKDTGT